MTFQRSQGLVRTGLFIGGVAKSGAGELPVIDPAEPSVTVGIAAAASREQALEAVAAAKKAQPAWAALTPAARAAMLDASLSVLAEFHDEDARILSLENGKIKKESLFDLLSFNRRFGLATALAAKVNEVTVLPGPPHETTVGYVPLGVVTIIVPYNWPLSILGASLPFALLAGDAVIVKPPPTTPLAITRVVQRVAEQLPPGVLNVVTGVDAEIGEALVKNDDVAMVSFTGSTGGGRRIMEMASNNLVKVMLELGGNDPAIILDDAVLDTDALSRMFDGTFRSTGQICMAVKRIYVHRSRYQEVVDGFTALLEKTVLGHGLDEETTMGPLNNARQRDLVAELVDEARAAGAEVREFASLPQESGLKDGYFLRPSLVLDPDPSLRVVREEQFGPTIPIIPFDDEAEAIGAANDTWAGLCSSVWSADLARAATVGAKLTSGYIFINNHGPSWLDQRAPFGGVRGSGMGREMGIEGLREFMATRSIAVPKS
ncbi:MAG: aldehyde dehydrogenase family protein [Lacisediminihabitans sp.]